MRGDALTVVIVASLALGSCESKSAEEQVADDMCRRLEACTGSTFLEPELDECLDTADTALLVVPDVESFAACFAGLSCTQAQDGASIAACADVDPASYECAGRNLHLCSSGGVCKDVECPALCAATGGRNGTCLMDNNAGHDVCWCN